MWGTWRKGLRGKEKTHILHEKTKTVGTEVTTAAVRLEVCIQECKHFFEHRNQRSSPYVGQDVGENVG